MSERKDLIQVIETIEPDMLLATISDMRTEGYRIGQACATKLESTIEVLYSFDKDHILRNIKVVVEDEKPELQSITSVYWSAFIYENEMHDLFGITFKNSALDYGGKFFKTSKPTPWNSNYKGGSDGK
jgi:ech hydrogenase subunit D